MKEELMTQIEQVIEHLEDYGSISREYAWSEYKIKRLGAVIHELKERGYLFNTRETNTDYIYTLTDEGAIVPKEERKSVVKKKYKFMGF
jgi:predicted transcriptional regulator